MVNKQQVEILEEEVRYRGFFNVIRYKLRYTQFKGGWSPPFNREIQDRKQVAAAIPYDPVLDKVVLIEQFRAGALPLPYPWLFEMVAGISEHDESMEEMITREMQEEAGLKPEALHKIYEFLSSPGGSNEYMTLYCAKVDASQAGGIHGCEDEQEDIRVHVIPCSQAFKMLEEGEIKNATSIIALQWLASNKEKMIKQWTS